MIQKTGLEWGAVPFNSSIQEAEAGFGRLQSVRDTAQSAPKMNT